MGELLSIVIPVYNAAQYLPGLLDDILSADLPELELLLIDDGSTDDSFQICQARRDGDGRVRVFRQKNAGPSAARNLGIAESRGEFIAFFDADDQLDVKAFAETVSGLAQYDAQIWASDFSRIAINGCVLDRICQIEESETPIVDIAYMDHFLSDGERVWNVWRYIFRRDFLLENGLRFREGVNCAEDLEFVVRALLCVKRPAFFHNPYYAYRAHYGDTLTRQYTVRRIRDLMEMLTLSASHLEGRGETWICLLRDKLIKEYLLNLSLCAELPKQTQPEALVCCQSAAGLLNQASSAKLRAVCAFVRAVGIARSAELLLDMKKVKRWIRKRKIGRYEGTGT